MSDPTMPSFDPLPPRPTAGLGDLPAGPPLLPSSRAPVSVGGIEPKSVVDSLGLSQPPKTTPPRPATKPPAPKLVEPPKPEAATVDTTAADSVTSPATSAPEPKWVSEALKRLIYPSKAKTMLAVVGVSGAIASNEFYFKPPAAAPAATEPVALVAAPPPPTAPPPAPKDLSTTGELPSDMRIESPEPTTTTQTPGIPTLPSIAVLPELKPTTTNPDRPLLPTTAPAPPTIPGLASNTALPSLPEPLPTTAPLSPLPVIPASASLPALPNPIIQVAATESPMIPALPALPTANPNTTPAPVTLPALPVPGATAPAAAVELPKLPSIAPSAPNITPVLPAAPNITPVIPGLTNPNDKLPTPTPKIELGTPIPTTPAELKLEPKVEPKTPPVLPAVTATPPAPLPKPSVEPLVPTIQPSAAELKPSPLTSSPAPIPKPEATLVSQPKLDTPTGPNGGPPVATSTAAIAATTAESRTNFDVDLHELRAGETYESICRQHYGDTKYAGALQAFNQNRPITSGSVQVPPMYVLRKRYPQMIGSFRPASAPPPTTAPTAPEPLRERSSERNTGGTGVEWSPINEPKGTSGSLGSYTVPRAGMTMWDVAEQVYGDRRDWRKVWNANPRLDPNERLAAGARLQLSSDARPVRE